MKRPEVLNYKELAGTIEWRYFALDLGKYIDSLEYKPKKRKK